MFIIDLFAGIGGFSYAIDKVFDEVNHIFCESNKQCQQILSKHWPGSKIIDNVRNVEEFVNIGTIEFICGGDPCPIRSRAKGNRESKSADLSGYFLSICGLCRPKWIFRENVPAPDDIDFVVGLECIGYESVIVRINGASVTGQNRTRDIIIASDRKRIEEFRKFTFKKGYNRRYKTLRYKETTFPCLTTHRNRYDSHDGFIYENGIGLRLASSKERQRLSGFPDQWLDGLSKTAVARMTGNAVIPGCIEPLFKIVKEIGS